MALVMTAVNIHAMRPITNIDISIPPHLSKKTTAKAFAHTTQRSVVKNVVFKSPQEIELDGH
jgi:hypothetical protein